MSLPLLLFASVAFAQSPAFPPDAVRVEKVYDGDTLTLATGQRVRVAHINTPELRPRQPFADEAKALATDWALDRDVVLTPAATPPVDSYGRLIARVNTERGDLSVGLLEAGLAHVFVVGAAPPDLAELLAAEASARTAGRGIWTLPTLQQTFHITSFHANARGDDTENVNGEYLRLCNVSGADADLEGWTIEDRSGDRFVLPRLEVPAGFTVAIRVGKGRTQRRLGAPLTVHLGSRVPVWNNRYEVLRLLDPTGSEVARRVHGTRRSPIKPE